ncbi:methyl-accepting chemotaxis protein [Phorcysia thermohydrogeniphila]|uniref:Methyl-accepting chemotaxis protein n=1 Tax=Phorcysia thermohydrogeniphila TaxID=936138 RepID=A0A4R1G8L1_9BACT|nr:methyl-accepting chemotaxis protein [Phorcysia thermohydrogeniphila]TCK02890.1 methyl-accepting chemotaxis protein [Phorcysia thermohydrogeniphila]
MKLLKDMSLGKKVTLGGLVGILVLTLILGFSSYRATKENLTTETFQRLTVVREAKSQHIEDYFSYMESLLSSIANSSLARESLRAFEESFYRLSEELDLDIDDVKRALEEEYERHYLNLVNYDIPGAPPRREVEFYLPKNPNGLLAQFLFIVENPYPVGKKNRLVYNEKYPCSYVKVHKKFHPDFNHLLKEFGLYDIFLVDKRGTIVYTTFKEKDFATNLISGPYSGTGIAKAFREAISSPPGRVVFSDFKPYEPSYNQPAAFIATPVYEGSEKVGVLIFQLPIDKIDAIVNFNYRFKEAGLGKTGEVYIAGSDYTLKNNIRFLREIDDPIVRKAGTTIGILKVDTLPVRKALKGEKGVAISENFFGKRVLVSYAPINVFGNRWAIVAEIEEDEILSGITSPKKNKMLIFTLLFLLMMVAAFLIFVKRSIVAPLNELILTTKDLAEGEGDLTRELSINRNDELGRAAKYFNAFIEKVRTIIERAKQSARRNVKIATVLKNNAENVKRRITEEKETVNKATETAAAITEPIKEFKELVSSSEKEVERASRKLTSTMNSIEELQKTIEKTERESLASIHELKELNREAESIKNIIEIIEDIADKTNLLALNASIEAAKAGETGKGFAVVAEEIRKLAEQIQRNTVNINRILNGIVLSISETTQKIEKSNSENMEFLRSVSEHVIGEMKEVTDVMEKTRTVSRTLSESSNGLIAQVESLIENIKEIDEISESNAKSVEEILLKIKELYREIDELNNIISTFKTKIR